MTTYSYIDASLHVTTLPATYVPPGTLVALSNLLSGATALTAANAATYVIPATNLTDTDSDGVSLSFTSAGNITVIPVGFVPARIKIINWTDGLQWEWMYGAPATNVIKTTDGTPAIATDTTTAIQFIADAMGGQGNTGYIQLTAALAAASKALTIRIEA